MVRASEHAGRGRSPGVGVSTLVFSLLVAGLVALCAAVTLPAVWLLNGSATSLVSASPAVTPAVAIQTMSLGFVAVVSVLLGCTMVLASWLRSRIRSV